MQVFYSFVSIPFKRESGLSEAHNEKHSERSQNEFQFPSNGKVDFPKITRSIQLNNPDATGVSIPFKREVDSEI